MELIYSGVFENTVLSVVVVYCIAEVCDVDIAYLLHASDSVMRSV